jgi:hypothetical protein
MRGIGDRVLDHPMVGIRFLGCPPLSQALSSVLCYGMVAPCHLLLVLFLAYGTLWAAEDIPQLKAKMGLPVIDELMGGCSLTCAFPWDVVPDDSGSSKIPALNDSNSLTAWTSARVGDRLVFKFSANLPRELNGTPFYGVDIANGRIHPESSFRDLGRVKRIRLFHNGRPLYTIQLADTRRWQKTSFPDVYLNIGDTLSLEIMEVYLGKTGSTAAITEIVLQGAH